MRRICLSFLSPALYFVNFACVRQTLNLEVGGIWYSFCTELFLNLHDFDVIILHDLNQQSVYLPFFITLIHFA